MWIIHYFEIIISHRGFWNIRTIFLVYSKFLDHPVRLNCPRHLESLNYSFSSGRHAISGNHLLLASREATSASGKKVSGEFLPITVAESRQASVRGVSPWTDNICPWNYQGQKPLFSELRRRRQAKCNQRAIHDTKQKEANGWLRGVLRKGERVDALLGEFSSAFKITHQPRHRSTMRFKCPSNEPFNRGRKRRGRVIPMMADQCQDGTRQKWWSQCRGGIGKSKCTTVVGGVNEWHHSAGA